MMMSLETLAEQIRVNLRDESLSVDEYKWQRAILYATARRHYPLNRQGNTAFGEWIKTALHEPARGSVRSDSKTTITNLIKCCGVQDGTGRFTQEQFTSIGYTNIMEIIQDWLYNNHREQFDYLLSVITRDTERDWIREQVRRVKAGEQLVPLPTPSFFIQGQQELQKRLLMADINYACEFYGLALESLSREDIRASRRRLSSRYHPDHGGSDFEMQCVLEVEQNLTQKLELMELQRSNMEMMESINV